MDTNTLALINAACTIVNALAVVVLVGITAHYARSTARMLAEMRRQARVQTIAAEIAAEGILNTQLSTHGTKRVAQLSEELRALQDG